MNLQRVFLLILTGMLSPLGLALAHEQSMSSSWACSQDQAQQETHTPSMLHPDPAETRTDCVPNCTERRPYLSLMLEQCLQFCLPLVYRKVKSTSSHPFFVPVGAVTQILSQQIWGQHAGCCVQTLAKTWRPGGHLSNKHWLDCREMLSCPYYLLQWPSKNEFFPVKIFKTPEVSIELSPTGAVLISPLLTLGLTFQMPCADGYPLEAPVINHDCKLSPKFGGTWGGRTQRAKDFWHRKS